MQKGLDLSYDELMSALLRQAVPSLWAHDRGIDLDGWQRQIADAGPGEDVVLCSRQAGKTTVAAVLVAHRLSVVDGSLSLILSKTERQAQELLRAAKGILDAGVVASMGQSHVETVHGSRAYALPGSNVDAIRGFSAPDLIVIDEAAMVTDDLYYAVRPMLSTVSDRARMVMLSTPKGRRGFFWEEWERGSGRKTMVTVYEVARISRDWIESERRRLPDWVFRQEYLCEFVDSEQAVFASDLVDRLFGDGEVLQLDEVLPEAGEALAL